MLVDRIIVPWGLGIVYDFATENNNLNTWTVANIVPQGVQETRSLGRDIPLWRYNSNGIPTNHL